MLAQKDTANSVAEQTTNHCALQAGDTLQLQFLDEPERGRYKVTVIGYVEGCSLMITAPKHNGHILLLRDGQQFVVRLLSGKQVIGFNSEVLKVYNNPFAYVHLKPPAQVQQCSVRNAYRTNVDNIASVQCLNDNEDEASAQHNSADVFGAKIIDISITGCQLELLKPPPEGFKKALLSTKIFVAEQERLLTLDTQICSSREVENKDKTVYLSGVKFLDMNDDKRLLLSCFVYERLVHEIFKD